MMHALACSVCFGGSEELMTHSINASVLVLVGAVVSVLAGIAYTGWTWAHRSKKPDSAP